MAFCCLYARNIFSLSPAAAAAAKSLQSCPTLCNPIDGSPPSSAIPGILQAPNCAEGTEAYVNNVKQELLNGTRHVFDVNTFTVGGAAPTEASVKPHPVFTFNPPEGTQFLKNGYYNESVYRSAPSFDVDIDGITIL